MLKPESYFADTVAAGWAPRHPCTDPAELARLEQSAVRGDCIAPLLIEGDTVYVDRNMKAEPGDIGSFALSARAAYAQNTPPLTADHRPRAPGDKWCKLVGVRHGLEMLYDRHGSEATATFMACESPDHTPILHPVRQIRRNGRLLFTAATFLALGGCGDEAVPFVMLPACEDTTNGSQIGNNAATVLQFATAASTGVTNSSTYTPVTSLTIGPFPWTIDLVATFTGGYTFSTAANPDIVLSHALLTDTITSNTTTILHIPSNQAAGTFASNSFSIEQIFTLPANATTTYYAQVNGTWIQAGSSLNIAGAILKIESIKR